ncbi:MAG: TonB-dependent receptor [Melioribacteraceae bacterium]
MYKLIIFILLLIFFASGVSAQQITVKGKLLDASNNDPLIGANIGVENTTLGTTTDYNGNFKIILKSIPQTLIFSNIGYKIERVIINKETLDLKILLKPTSYMLQEISVFSKQRDNELNVASIQNEQVKNFAGFTKDALRSVQLMPGVSNNNEGSPLINVRGGTYDENLVLVNGVEIYSPFHLKAFTPMGVGIFNIDMVKNINFSAGGFSAEFGNALSSIMNIEYAKGNRNEYAAKIDLSMIDLSALVQGPITSKGSFSLGVRKSYLDLLLRMGAPSGVRADYYDIQSILNYEVSNSDIITATIIYSKDNQSQDPENTISSYKFNSMIDQKPTYEFANGNYFKTGLFSYDNSLLAVRYDKIFSSFFSSQTILSLYNELEDEYNYETNNIDHSFSAFPDRFIKYNAAFYLKNKLEIRTLSLKQNFMVALSPFFTIKAGISYKQIFYNVDQNKRKDEIYSENLSKYPDVITTNYPKNPAYNDTLNLNISSFRNEAYIENILQFSDNLIVNAGSRLDYFDMNKQTKISPRIGLSYNLPLDVILRLSWGIFYQPPTYKQLRFSEATDQNTSFQKATHYIAGLEKNFSSAISCKLEYYYKQYSDLLPVSRVTNSTLQYRTKENNTEGYATGFDFQFIARFPSLDVWLSYGFLVAKEKLYSETNYYPRYTDQKHTISSVVSIDLGLGWESSVRYFYGSGYAFTPSNLIYSSSDKKYVWVPSDKNSDHYPPYTRIDLRLGKTFELFDHPLKFYIDILNILGKENVLSYRYSFDNKGNPARFEESLLPTIPSLGLSYSF